MSLHARTNIAKFNSKVGEFLILDKYTDATITCEDQNFTCHRLTLASASNFFDTRFSRDFKVGRRSHVVLKNTSANIFQDVLEFIYTGYVAISTDNVCRLLEASDLLELAGLEDLCVGFLQKNKITGEGILELFAFACTKKDTMLLKMLSQEVLLQFNQLKESEAFLELPFNAMNTILSQLSNWTSSEVKNDEVLLNAIIQWIEYAREERLHSFKKNLKMVRFKNMTAEYMRFIIENVYNPSVVAQPDSSSDLVHRSGNPEVPKTSSVIARDYVQMHVFIRSILKEFSGMLHIFSFENIRQCSLSHTMDLVGVMDKRHWIRSVPMANNAYLYCLYFRHSRYSRCADDTFIENQSFCMYTSANMRSEFTLTPPPLVFGDVSLCPIQNNIYAYNHTLFHKVILTSTLTNFDREEITRGIYLYNCELNDWFPVPKMKVKLQDSCMVTCDQVLYLIGGATNNNPSSTQNMVQSYDYRTDSWRSLPNAFYYHRGGDCCVLNNQIYVCGGEGGGTVVGRYDITACKWEPLAPMPRNTLYHRVIPYSNELWLMGCFTDGAGALRDYLGIQIYNPSRNKWSTSTELKETVEDTFGADKDYYFLDGVVFSHL